ncbi:MAG: metallophosphoesterase [Acidobacteriota bacterium]|nr:metallophosphoesterase [Acidobacteriota bacterium]
MKLETLGNGSTAKEYYFVSDLHFGGDGQLQVCDYTEEFIAFLRELAAKGEAGAEVELIIAGDTFGFWELTSVQGTTQLTEIISHHTRIFEQFRQTGEKIKITLMVGNHDYDLACYPEFVPMLAAYNIRLDLSLAVVRDIGGDGGRKIWVEHGQQIDPYNAATDYGNKNALPLGYFITEALVSGASKYSVFGTSDWLKDIRSVDVRQIPDWLISNYFYNEMNLLLRWLLIPFLLLLTITIFALLAQAMELLGVSSVNLLLENSFIRSLGLAGDIVRWVLTASMTVWFFVLVISIPLYFIYRDIRSTLQRMQIFPPYKSAPTNEANNIYLDRARAVFSENPQVCAYIFGHTHDAFLVEEPGGRVIINTGTWLKILKRVSVRFGLLPGIYYPTFRLNYFKIYAENEKIIVEYVEIPKEPEEKLTLLQRFLIIGRKPELGKPIPVRTVL